VLLPPPQYPAKGITHQHGLSVSTLRQNFLYAAW
jgi:hypothetical protein